MLTIGTCENGLASGGRTQSVPRSAICLSLIPDGCAYPSHRFQIQIP